MNKFFLISPPFRCIIYPSIMREMVFLPYSQEELFVKNRACRRACALFLAVCLVLGFIPVFMPVTAEAVSGIDSLTCAGFISNPTRQNYIDVMMKYYINNNSSLQSTLNNGKSVVFMFEGGSDNYDKYPYVDEPGATRLQAVCIVVQLDASGYAKIVFNSENCSSIPDDANWSTPGYETSGSTTILDGIYSFQTISLLLSILIYK